MKALVIGIGYVGLSTAVVLAQKNEVDICDIIQSKIDNVNQRISPFDDEGITEYFKFPLMLKAMMVNEVNYQEYDFIIIAVPTNYQKEICNLDTTIIEQILDFAKDTHAIIVIRSTVPFGFTQRMSSKYENLRILYCPEFLREGTALLDTLKPSRIVIGGNEEVVRLYKDWITSSVVFEETSFVLTTASEAEAIKLFSNTYLAMRVAFFNEIDNFSINNNLDSKTCIEGMCMDRRIGNYYNNPSFGYGGSCLPKDTKSLKNSYANIPNNIISAIVDSNITRQRFIAKELIHKHVEIIGIYRLCAKTGSDNIRESSTLEICKLLIAQGQKIIIYEPLLHETSILGCEIMRDLAEFKSKSDLVVANRVDGLLEDVSEKLYTRDIFNNN